jgi:putative addiction module killer protein
MMMQIETTQDFVDWLSGLTDPIARKRIAKHLARAEAGNLGNWKALKGVQGIFEMRIDHGPGYRLYFARRGQKIIVLLGGGTKQDQTAAIAVANRLWNG